MTVKLNSLSHTGLRLMLRVSLPSGATTYQGDGVSGVLLKDVKLEVLKTTTADAGHLRLTQLASVLATLGSVPISTTPAVLLTTV